MITPTVYIALTSTAFGTGFIDAVAGGGGLVMVPALLFFGVSPIEALAANKLQSMCGTGMALWRFHRCGYVDIASYVPTATAVILGAGAGTIAVQAIGSDAVKVVLPILLACVSLYVLFSPRMTDDEVHHRITPAQFVPLALGIGGYDGFFGPGAGSFYTTSLVALRGLGLTRATGVSKLLNCSSNIASVMVFAVVGNIPWVLGGCLAAGAVAGSWIGSHTAMRWGAQFIRPLLVTISFALTARVAWSYFVS